jgi:hypothetical protein
MLLTSRFGARKSSHIFTAKTGPSDSLLRRYGERATLSSGCDFSGLNKSEKENIAKALLCLEAKDRIWISKDKKLLLKDKKRLFFVFP